jgi:DNA-directed RNA polymerase alpha subunit
MGMSWALMAFGSDVSDTDAPEAVMNKPVEELDVSLRVSNALKDWNAVRKTPNKHFPGFRPFRTIGDLMGASDDELLQIKNVGEAGLREIRGAVAVALLTKR